MPIIGLSDRQEAFPEIGKIHKGAKKRKNAQGKEIFGEELTYFRVEWGEGEEKAAAQFEQIYGKTPNAIRVIFPFNEIERFWDPWKVAFTAGTFLGRSDGEFVDFLQNVKFEILVKDGLDREGKKMPHPANNVAGFDFDNKPVEFKNSGILKVLVYELPRAAYLSVITGSTHDIANLSSQLAAFKELNGGQLAGIPFILRRVPKMISTPNKNGPRVRRKKYLISIEVDPEWIKRKFGELRTLALPDFEGEPIVAGELAASVPTDYDEGELEADDLGAGPAESEESREEKPRELVEVLGSRCVDYAAKHWNMEASQAAIELGKKNLGKMIDWNDFVEIVTGVGGDKK